MRDNGSILIEDARVVFRNFAGKELPYNREGDRNFSILLDEELAQGMIADGWNVKRLKPREGSEDETPQAYVQVAVGFKGRPPKICLISSKGRTDLNEKTCEIIDWADIMQYDVIIRPYNWTVRENSGIKAYLQSLYAIINEDALDLKYADVEEIPSRSGRVVE